MKKQIKEMLEKVRKAISECKAPEKDMYEELVAEAEGWNMRLQEIEEEEKDV